MSDCHDLLWWFRKGLAKTMDDGNHPTLGLLRRSPKADPTRMTPWIPIFIGMEKAGGQV
jgi:hypothetical protein